MKYLDVRIVSGDNESHYSNTIRSIPSFKWNEGEKYQKQKDRERNIEKKYWERGKHMSWIKNQKLEESEKTWPILYVNCNFDISFTYRILICYYWIIDVSPEPVPPHYFGHSWWNFSWFWKIVVISLIFDVIVSSNFTKKKHAKTWHPTRLNPRINFLHFSRLQ